MDVIFGNGRFTYYNTCCSLYSGAFYQMECNTTKRYNLIHACPIHNIEDHITNTEKDKSNQINLICEMQAIQQGTILAPKRERFGFLIVGLLYNSNFSLS